MFRDDDGAEEADLAEILEDGYREVDNAEDDDSTTLHTTPALSASASTVAPRARSSVASLSTAGKPSPHTLTTPRVAARRSRDATPSSEVTFPRTPVDASPLVQTRGALVHTDSRDASLRFVGARSNASGNGEVPVAVADAAPTMTSSSPPPPSPPTDSPAGPSSQQSFAADPATPVSDPRPRLCDCLGATAGWHRAGCPRRSE
jgi:hypothetical protein